MFAHTRQGVFYPPTSLPGGAPPVGEEDHRSFGTGAAALAEPISYLSVFLIGVVASVVGAMVGGGSLLSIPFLIFLGLPPHVAIATDRFAGLGAALTALHAFWKAGRIVWRLVPLLAAASLAGSLAGATLLVRVEAVHLEPLVGGLVLLLLPVLFARPGLGVEARKVGRARMRAGLALYFLVQVLAGFFGAGTGTLIFYTLMFFFGVTIIQVAATQIVPFLVLTVSSLAVFAAHAIIDYRVGLVLLAGTALGGHLGARLAIRGGEVWVRRLFAVVVLASGTKLLLF